MNVITVNEIPDLPALYRSLMVGAVPIPGLGAGKRKVDDPQTAYRVEGVRVDTAHLARYCQATGLRLGNELPATYLYALAFPLAIKVMAARDFPFPAVGVVHLSNRIEQKRPLRVDERCDIAVHAENLRPHRKGLVIDMVTTYSVDGEEIWRQTSVFLGQGAKFTKDTPRQVRTRPEAERFLDFPGDEVGTPTATLRFSPESTRVYAAASGDKNPIHVSTVGAKLFGFPAPIAHGMYTHARMLSVLDGTLPRAVRISADFYKPVILPATTGVFVAPSVATNTEIGARTVTLRKAKDPSTLHVACRVEPLN